MTKKSKTFAKILTIVSISVCLALSVSLADLFSSLITVGGFSFTTNTTKTSAFNLYAISLYSSQTKASADDMAAVVQSKNGAGYVHMTNESYEILASAYENLADAEKVKNNLTESGTECKIITLEYPEIVLSITLTSEEKTALDNAILVYKNLYKKLYDLSVSLDTNLLTEIQAKVTLSDIVSYFSKIQSNFEALFNPKITTSLLELKLSLMNVDATLEDVSNFKSSSVPYSSKIKLAYFEILQEQISLSKKI